jgi:hypothetical protein
LANKGVFKAHSYKEDHVGLMLIVPVPQAFSATGEKGFSIETSISRIRRAARRVIRKPHPREST